MSLETHLRAWRAVRHVAECMAGSAQRVRAGECVPIVSVSAVSAACGVACRGSGRVLGARTDSNGSVRGVRGAERAFQRVWRSLGCAAQRGKVRRRCQCEAWGGVLASPVPTRRSADSDGRVGGLSGRTVGAALYSCRH